MQKNGAFTPQECVKCGSSNVKKDVDHKTICLDCKQSS